MSDVQPVSYGYPNQLGRIILMAMEEVMGKTGLKAVLNQAHLGRLIDHYPPNNLELQFKFEEVSAIQKALEELYGPRGGHGLSMRIGRACFKHGLQAYGPVLGFTDLAFRLLPLDEKMRTGARFFAEIFNRFTDQRVEIEEDSENFYWKIIRCPVCWQRTSEEPVCHLAVGLLQEALYWVSSGKTFNIEETACVAKGDPACLIITEKKPIE